MTTTYRCRLLILLFFLSACATNQRGGTLLVDVEKACSEDFQLAKKLMNMDFEDFKMQKSFRKQESSEKVYDLNSNKASKYGLQWMQVRFENNKLQSLWFGERSSLENDLRTIGLRSDRMKTQDNKPLEDFSTGAFYIKDLSGNMIKVEHEGAPIKGIAVTCFPIRKRH